MDIAPTNNTATCGVVDEYENAQTMVENGVSLYVWESVCSNVLVKTRISLLSSFLKFLCKNEE